MSWVVLLLRKDALLISRWKVALILGFLLFVLPVFQLFRFQISIVMLRWSSIGMICNTFPETLSKHLLALCPNITSSGIQFAAAQLPNLELMDCCMTICNPDLDSPTTQKNNDLQLQRTPHSKLHLIYQKLIINHTCLKKLSLWGCSVLDALYLNCPELNDLNLNSCTHLNPERLLHQCPILECVPALGCRTRWFKSFRIRYVQILWPGKIIFIANVFLIALKESGYRLQDKKVQNLVTRAARPTSHCRPI